MQCGFSEGLITMIGSTVSPGTELRCACAEADANQTRLGWGKRQPETAHDCNARLAFDNM
jgi:hypothetical protein